MTKYDESHDVIVIGSGISGLFAAIAAAKRGARTLLLEKESVWGGTTAYSGSILWIPQNHLMKKDGFSDSEENALAYLEATIGDAGPASSLRRRQAYVRTAAPVVKALEDDGFQWAYRRDYWDYFPDQSGAHHCRGVGAGLFDANKLGPSYRTMCRPGNFPALAIYPNELQGLIAPLRSAANLATMLRVVIRTLWWRLSGRIPLAAGQALVAQLMVIARRYGVELRLDTRLTGLLTEDGKVIGIEARIGENVTRLLAKAGIILCAGGFARNDEFRRRYQAVGGGYTAAHPGDTGDAVQAGMAIGAATALMDEAFWTQTVCLPDGTTRIVLWERVMPHSMMVDQSGKRYLNEAQSYDKIGRSMIEHNRQTASIPTWLIMDARHRRRYPFLAWPGGYTPKAMIERGFFIKAKSITDLAAQCNIDPETLSATVERFNTFARNGVDADFGRGNDKFDHTYADATVQPNPCLGTLERAPFWAVRIYPGDFGTKGGLLTDEHSRVLREKDGEPIAGLYAAGNTTASITGHTYPGPGCTLGPAAIFGHIAGDHAAAVGNRT